MPSTQVGFLFMPLLATALRPGFPVMVKKEHQNATCISHNIPSWLKGYFIRQTCGALGEFNGSHSERIDHFLDCMGMVSVYEFSGEEVRYSNKYYDTRPYRIWNANGRNMSRSKVAWSTLYSHINPVAFRKWRHHFPMAVDTNPNVDFWLINKTLIATDELPYGYSFNVSTLHMDGAFQFTDNNIGFGQSAILIGNPASPSVTIDGTIYSTVFAWVPKSAQVFTNYRIIYRISPGSATREEISRITLKDINLNHCQRDSDSPSKWTYSVPSGDLKELGSISSVMVTPKHVILPISSYIWNPCFLNPETNKDNQFKPFHKTYMQFHNDVMSHFYVMDKATGDITHYDNDKPYLFTHQLNAYEDDDGIINADLLTYDNPDIYTKYMQVDSMLNFTETPFPSTASMCRFRLQSTSSASGCEHLTNEPKLPVEFPQINHRYSGRKYQYVFSVWLPWSANGGILKTINNKMDNNIWYAPDGVYPQQPIFVQHPDYSYEDGGILIVPAVDAVKNKGTVYVLSAMDMTLVGQVTAPDMVPFGLHGHFYTYEQLGVPYCRSSASAVIYVINVINLAFCILLLS